MRQPSVEEEEEASSCSASLSEDPMKNLTTSQKDKQQVQRLLSSTGLKEQAIAQGLDHCMTQAHGRREERRSQAAIDKPQ